mgnify:CR=1 FL=1
MDNFYEILEIPESASDSEITRAYKMLIQVWHPDRFTGKSELLKKAEQKAKQINEAFRHLSDPSLKAKHDAQLKQNRSRTRPLDKPFQSQTSTRNPPAFTITICPNPQCSLRLRVHRTGLLKVSCPKCRTSFMYDPVKGTQWDVNVPQKKHGMPWIVSAAVICSILIVVLAVLSKNSSRQQPLGVSKSTDSAPFRTLSPGNPVLEPIKTEQTTKTSHLDSKRSQVALPTGTNLQRPQGKKGLGALTINNGSDLDAVVKLVRVTALKSPLRLVYVQAGSQLKIDGISPCICRVSFYLGIDWDKSKKRFLRNAAYKEFADSFDFDEVAINDRIQYSTHTVTLHRVPEGKAHTRSIDESSFWEQETD